MDPDGEGVMSPSMRSNINLLANKLKQLGMRSVQGICMRVWQISVR